MAYVSFQRINVVSERISLSLKNEYPASLIAKNLEIELGAAENYARTYYLTDDKESIKNYHNAIYNIQYLLLNLNTHQFIEDSTIIDSITYFSKELVRALKSQSYSKNPKLIVYELDELSDEINEIYNSEKLNHDNVVNSKDTSVKKKNFFKRLFSRKKDLNEKNKIKELNNREAQLKQLEIQGQLKDAVIATKSTQSKLIDENRKSEFELTKTIFICKDRISELIERLIIKEDKRKAINAIIAGNELDKLRTFTLFSTALLSVFLLTLIYLIYAYIRKKAQYEKLLVKAKDEAETLAIAKESYLNNMSHEIKTPLNAIQGFSEILGNSDLSIEQKKQLNIIQKSTVYLNTLINNILTHARLNSGKVVLFETKVNIKNEINEIYQLLLPQAQAKKIQFELIFNECEDAFLIIDIDKLKQVLYNILGNAIKFTSKGSVTLEVSQSKIKFSSLNFVIKDTGIGIDSKTLPKLFEEFEQGSAQTQVQFGGTGLGLVITKKIVHLLGGQIKLNSVINSGTEVIFNIPYNLPADKLTNVEFEKTFKFDYLANKKILIVDDEEYNRLLLRTILTNYGPAITEANNGIKALLALKETNFDLIIMDIRMPEMNGIEATIEIRKGNADVIILGATAVINEEKITSCKQAGMNDIIFKPISMEELSVKLNKLFTLPNERENTVDSDIKSIDTSINLNAIDHDTGGDEKFKKELIKVFHKSLNETVAHINQLVEDNNYNLISEKAHKIIPSCKHFETHRLLTALRYIEEKNNISAFDSLKYKQQIAIINDELVKINKFLSPFLT